MQHCIISSFQQSGHVNYLLLVFLSFSWDSSHGFCFICKIVSFFCEGIGADQPELSILISVDISSSALSSIFFSPLYNALS